MRGTRLGIAAAAYASLALASVAHAEVIELAELEKRALEKHALLTMSALRERAASAEIRQAESAYKPRIGLNVDANAAPGRALRKLPGQLPGQDDFYVQGVPSLGRENLGQAFLPRPRVGAGVQFDAYLYDFGRTEAAVAVGRAKKRAAEADGELSRKQIIAMVRGAYLGWLSAELIYAIAAKASADATQRSARVAALIEEGARPRTDFAPVDADRLLSELERERAEGELENARLTLEASVGEPLPEAAEPDPGLLELDASMRAPEPDPALRVLAQQRLGLEASARLSRKQRAPLLSTTLSAGVYGQLTQTAKQDEPGEWNYGFSAFPAYSLGLSLTVPLWDGGETKAAAEAAEARAAELGLQSESSERERQQELVRAHADVEHAQKRHAMAEQLRVVCTTRVSDAEAGYELGAMQFDQVQQARALLRRAETEVVLAQVARAEAILRVAP